MLSSWRLLYTGSYILLSSIAITLLGAWMSAHLFAGVAPQMALFILGGAAFGFAYCLALAVGSAFFPDYFFAAFRLPLARTDRA